MASSRVSTTNYEERELRESRGGWIYVSRIVSIRSIDMGLDASGVPVYRIPERALQPTDSGSGTFAWKFTNLVSDSDVRIVLPGAESALGRLFLLFRLTAVAILLFGAGCWYLNEQIATDRLENFRWGHFTLLASTYSLFFVVFGVIVYHGEMSVLPAVVVSSLPMLVLHVSRILGFRFALIKVLPLAILTLGVVINGVYGGGVSDYIFIALLIVSVGYLTVTYQPNRKSGLLVGPAEA
jgi:hypothetical protein